MSKLKKILTYRTTLLVIILLFFAKFLGFVKNIFLAKYYGTSVLSDAYQMAISIPMIIIGVVLYSYQAFTKGYFLAEKDGKEHEYTSTFINFNLIIIFFIMILFLLLTDKIVCLFAPGFNSEQINYTSRFLIPIAFGTSALVIANILAEYLRCKNSFVISQFAYLTINVIEISTIFLAYYYNYNWLSYGFFIANFTYLIILILLCYKKGLRYKFLFKKIEFNRFYKILIPIFLSSLITDLNSMIDKMFASKSGTGIVSTLSYATNIKTVSLIIAAGLLTVLFPKISKKCVDKDYVGFDKLVNKSLYVILAIYLPITLGMFIMSSNIVRIVYFRGVFSFDALSKTSLCLQMYLIGITGISIRDLFIKALYCLEKGKFVIIISFVSVFMNVILNFTLFNLLGYSGLPLATSLSVWIIIPIVYIYYKYSIKKLISQ